MKRYFIVSSTNAATSIAASPSFMGDAVSEQARIRRERAASKAAVTATTLPHAGPDDAQPLLIARVKAKWPTSLPLLKSMAAAHLPLPCPVREVPWLRLVSLHETHDAAGHGFVTLRFQRMGNVPATRSVTLRLRELLALLAGV